MGGSWFVSGSESGLVLSNISVTGNTSRGTVIDAPTIDIQDSVIEQNEAGGVSALNSLNVPRCIINNNWGKGAGAKYNTIVDSIISGNTKGVVSDGDSESIMTIERCLISGNDRSGGGGSSGIRNDSNQRLPSYQ